MEAVLAGVQTSTSVEVKSGVTSEWALQTAEDSQRHEDVVVQASRPTGQPIEQEGATGSSLPSGSETPPRGGLMFLLPETEEPKDEILPLF